MKGHRIAEKIRARLFCTLLAVSVIFCLAGCVADPAEPASIPAMTESSTDTPTTEPTVMQTTQVETQSQVMEAPEPEDEDFVKVADYIPDIWIELPYSTDQNFTGEKIYDFDELWLRYGTVKKLMAAQEKLAQNQLYLKVWDGFRPPAAQFKLWEICPDPTYVSDPNKGFSSHSRGNTVDITLVHADGTELTMPTDFDDFSKLADRDYSDCTPTAAANALILEQIMTECGFKPYHGEWWHFSDTQAYPVEHTFEPVQTAWYYANCNEFISLRVRPDTAADVIIKIPANEEFQLMAMHDNFALVDYEGMRGWVLKSYILPAE